MQAPSWPSAAVGNRFQKRALLTDGGRRDYQSAAMRLSLLTGPCNSMKESRFWPINSDQRDRHRLLDCDELDIGSCYRCPSHSCGTADMGQCQLFESREGALAVDISLSLFEPGLCTRPFLVLLELFFPTPFVA